jgi:deoxyribonuclease V
MGLLHAFDVTPAEARRIQLGLRGRVSLRGGPLAPRLIAGADVAYHRRAPRLYAAVVVLAAADLSLVEESSAAGEARFPYQPGLLSFREAPAVLEAYARLECRPDVLLVDGHGIAHPRRFGLASHLGVLLDLPSVGVAKRLLVGEHAALGGTRGSRVPLRHAGRRVGEVVRTRTGVRPVYVSPGHRVGFERAVRLVLASSRGFRLPEPTRQAHMAVNRLRRQA